MKTTKKLSILLFAVLAMLVPQTTMAAEPNSVPMTIDANGIMSWDAQAVANLTGDTLIIDLDNLTVVGTYSGRSVIARRGCPDDNAACWASGTPLGDMQFSGTGTISGYWPGRNNFYTGNKYASITFTVGSIYGQSGTLPPNHQIGAYINGKYTSVDGLSVTRW